MPPGAIATIRNSKKFIKIKNKKIKIIKKERDKVPHQISIVDE